MNTRPPRRGEILPPYAPSPFKQSADAAVPRRAGCFNCDWSADVYAYGAKKNPRDLAADHRHETKHGTWVECDPAQEFAADQWRSKIQNRGGGLTFGGL